MKTYTEIIINGKMYWFRIYGSRAGKTLEIRTVGDTISGYECLRIPFHDSFLGEDETMKDFVKDTIIDEKL